MIANEITHYVSGFAGPKHPRAQHGELLVTTWHRGAGSKDCEVAAWQLRIKRGDASRCEVRSVGSGLVEVIQ